MPEMGANNDIDFSSTRFLIIEDLENYRLFLKCLVNDLGASSADTVGDGELAIKMMMEHEYDVILCDYNLGLRKNGQQVLEEARHNGYIGHSTLFIMISAENVYGVVMAALEYLPDDYLKKPVTIDILKKRLKRVYEKKDLFMDIFWAIDKKEYAQVIELVDSKIVENPKYTLELVKIKGNVCLKAGKIGLAEKLFDKALSMRPFPWAMAGRGKTKLLNGNYEEAITIFSDLLKEYPASMEAYDLLAEAYEKNGQVSEAQHILAKATTHSPNIVSRQRKLGQLARDNDDLDAAEKAFTQAIKAGKYSVLKSIDEHVNLASIYNAKGDFAKALAVISKVEGDFNTKDDKNKLGALHNQILKGSLYKSTGEEKRAKEAFAKAKEAFQQINDELPKTIVVDMFKACTSFGDRHTAKKILHILEDKGEHKIAQSFRDKLEADHAEHTEDDYAMINRAGMKLYERGRLEQAVEMFEEAVFGLPDNNSYKLNAAQAMLMLMTRQGKDEYMLNRSRDYFAIVTEAEPDNDRLPELARLIKGLSK